MAFLLLLFCAPDMNSREEEQQDPLDIERKGAGES